MPGRTWQMFTAPGDTDTPLPIPPSPWHFERDARIPLEHWDLILDFARALNPHYAVLLDQTTYVTEQPDGPIALPPEKIREALAIIRELQGRIAVAPPLVPVATEEIPNTFINEEHIRMLDTIAAVFEESLRLGQPFDAWLG